MTNTRSPRLPLTAVAGAALASVLMLGLAGCAASGSASGSGSNAGSGSGSGTPSGASTPPAAGGAKSSAKVGPCVLTPAEVAAVLHEPINSAKPDANECSYSGGGNFFSVNLFAGSAGGSWEDQLKVLSVVNPAITVNGVGDKAAGSGVSLDVQSGSYIMNFIGIDDAGSKTWPKSVALAKALIAKLP